jgi:YVTN family beta-propeller protein
MPVSVYALGVFLICSTACTPRVPADLAAPGPADAKQVLVLVSNEGSDDLSFIDAASGTVLRTLPIGKRPRGLRVSRDGKHLYVALSGSPRGGPNVDESQLPPPDRSQDGIGVVDLERDALLTRFTSGNDPETVDTSPDGRLLAVANEDSAQASLIDADTGALLARIEVGLEPEGVRFTPDGRFLYVTSESNQRIDVIDVAARAVVARIPTGKRPRNVVFTPDGARAFVSCELSGRVDVIDAREHRALAAIEIEGSPKPLPMGMALDGSRHRLYVTLGRAGEVAVLDSLALRVLERIPLVGERPWGIVLSPDGTKLYTANGSSGDVTVIDTESRHVLGRIAVGKQPWGLATVRVRDRERTARL